MSTPEEKREERLGQNLNFAIVQAMSDAAKGLTPDQRRDLENQKIVEDARREVCSRAGSRSYGVGNWFRKP